jgi:choice-of-anchor C domain-containing protein
MAFCLTAVGALAAGVALGDATNLLVNGSFESSAYEPVGEFVADLPGGATGITGWTVKPVGIDYIGYHWVHSDGIRSIDLNAYEAGGIRQSIVTTPGCTYQVEFDLAGNPAGKPAPYLSPNVKTLLVSAAGQSQAFSFDVTNTSRSAMGWMTKQWSFTATDSTTTLAFDSTCIGPEWLGSAGWFGPAIDNVRVFKISDPGQPPVADAGADLSIFTAEKAVTVIGGMASDPDNDPLLYRWVEGGATILDWSDVVDGLASLSLAPLSGLSIGSHVLTLEVKDAAHLVSDQMMLTLCNTPPEGAPAPTYLTVELGSDAVFCGSVADFDGDVLSYEWAKGTDMLASGTADPPAGGAPVDIAPLTIPGGDPRFPPGVHEIQFIVDDSANVPQVVTVELEVKDVDTEAPTLDPVPSLTMLWPPDHALRAVTIYANAVDNSGGEIVLSASVQSNESPDESGDGSTEQDCYVDWIDDAAGIILVQLRAERSGTGDGRVYTVSIGATDASGNQSSATVDIRVPHDRRKR